MVTGANTSQALGTDHRFHTLGTWKTPEVSRKYDEIDEIDQVYDDWDEIKLMKLMKFMIIYEMQHIFPAKPDIIHDHLLIIYYQFSKIISP